MAFLNDIDKKITTFGQKASQKMKEMPATYKLTNEIKNNENQKNEYFLQLGKLFYAEHKDLANEQEKVLIERIDALEAEIQRLNAEIDKEKGVTHCTNCNAEIPVNSMFCNICGAKVERKEPEPVVQGKTCKNCGAAILEEQLFCTNCGSKVESTPAQDFFKLNEELDRVEFKQPVCPNCGEAVSEEQDFCIYCGTPLKK